MILLCDFDADDENAGAVESGEGAAAAVSNLLKNPARL